MSNKDIDISPFIRFDIGAHGARETPVPIPNTVVKPIYAEGTWLETAWEIRKLLVRLNTYMNL